MFAFLAASTSLLWRDTFPMKKLQRKTVPRRVCTTQSLFISAQRKERE